MNPDPDRDETAATASPALGGDRTQTVDRTQTGEGTPRQGAELRDAVSRQLRDPARYRVLGEHGRGGLGRVSRAHDQDLGRDVAIKELISRGQLSEVRFLREALITARLEHPGIVPVYEAGRWPDGTPFYAMKLVAGRPLRDLIAERTTVEERIGLLHHVIAVADAIAYAHDRHVIHRDLKPANVIVGEFGETIVIDWGLAKDLTAGQDTSESEGHSGSERDAQLTSTGSVLGTPAYMAPEQERGEHVDQRADVFAIGAMLWELCALARVPPADAVARRSALRGAGIDEDLATIIVKATEPDPDRRYVNAGALAADLKAFKSGARIAARRYTLPAMLAHWTRRHRALAVAIAAAVVVTFGGGALYVVNMAAERRRVDAALARAELANDGLTLKQAELLLRTDPTAASAALAGYHGSAIDARKRLFAEATGRGVARATVQPHTSPIQFVVGTDDGGIITLAEDRSVRLTRGETSEIIASDVSTEVRWRYAPATRQLAYAAVPSGISVLDLTTRVARHLLAEAPKAMAFDAAGTRLASLDDQSGLTVWSLVPGGGAPVLRHELRPGAHALAFETTARLVIATDTSVELIPLDGATAAPPAIAFPEVVAIDAHADAVLVGNAAGTIALLSPALALVQQLPVCRQRLKTAQLSARSGFLMFACQEGLAGLVKYDLAARTMAVVGSFQTRGATDAVLDASGQYLVAWGEDSVAQVYDTDAMQVSHYEGHAGPISAVATPTPGTNSILVGDVTGRVRIWGLPVHVARKVAQLHEPLFNVGYVDAATVAAAGGNLVRLFDLSSRAITELAGHTRPVFRMRFAPDRSTFLSSGYDSTVRVWRARDRALLRVFSGHATGVAGTEYIEHGRRVLTIGDDGRLLAWSIDGSDAIELFKIARPLVALAALLWNDHAVVVDGTGAMWDVSPAGASRQVRTGDGTAVRIRSSLDGRLFAVGGDDGVTTIYETQGWTIVKQVKLGGSIDQLKIDPRGRDALIVSADHHVRLISLDPAQPAPWDDIAADSRFIVYSPDGDTMVILCSEGVLWMYRRRDGIWAYEREHESDVQGGQFSPDGRSFASTDSHGALIARDIQATFARFTEPR